MLSHQKVSGGRHRDEFGEPLDDAEEEGLKEGHWIGRVNRGMVV
jgi:hypothetical protein